MITSSNLGFPRIGSKRELKKTLEKFWSGKANEAELLNTGRLLRQENWSFQKEQGINHIPSNDFSFYDQVLDTTAMLGAVPHRYGWQDDQVDLKTYFAMARGEKGRVTAMEMTKWFDSNYHYIVPEFEKEQSFRLSSSKVIKEFEEAKQLGIITRPVLLGPVSFLLLGKSKQPGLDPLSLISNILPIYEEVLNQLAGVGAEWVQLDEPCLALNLSYEQRASFGEVYSRLSRVSPRLKLLLATYFGDLLGNLGTVVSLPVAALHLDLIRAPLMLDRILPIVPKTLSLSLGLVDGRNVWRTDLDNAIEAAKKAKEKLGSDRIIIGPSCSLMFSPVDLDLEVKLDKEVKNWMSYAKQKIKEISTITKVLNEGDASAKDALLESRTACAERKTSPRIHKLEIKNALKNISPDMFNRLNPYSVRKVQQEELGLPLFPTTTIGSFCQTDEVRTKRANHRSGKLSQTDYDQFLRTEVEKTIRFQEQVGLDVLVHGESERNDMVEFFGEQLEGFVSTENGWVQSYGSRCVKPPVIFGDVVRTKPMTVDCWQYAQSLTPKPVKGMLTGPVTILQWSFVRDDQPRSVTCRQIALAIRDEVIDLEKAGVKIIQIDEPAIREGLPLRQTEWESYLQWAVDCFRLSSSGVRDKTQIHTHMCYSEFNDIIEAIGKMDADVLSIETSRSQMELLDVFSKYKYPNEIGPGVYDIHSPRIPTSGEMKDLLLKAMEFISPQQLWVNPDCGLKTRSWEEVSPALDAMIAAAKNVRTHIKEHCK
ncbi:MAG: 5-methyltetrahydropteroyltriglutamate--homocysteine S-methyltransferase [Bdellovibrionia bacterium]